MAAIWTHHHLEYLRFDMIARHLFSAVNDRAIALKTRPYCNRTKEENLVWVRVSEQLELY